MIRISLPYLYYLATYLRPLETLPYDKPLGEVIFPLLNAQSALSGFLQNSVFAPQLKAAIAPGYALLAEIQKHTTDTADRTKSLEFYEVYGLRRELEAFETVLAAEMNVGNAYLVSKKRGYDTSDLIENAENLFPVELQTKVPDAIEDIRQAGKCIAFELATAAGFHLMRANELVLRKYYDVVTEGAARPRTNNMGDYLREMERLNRGNPKVIAVLRQIKDLHRNEFIHPEESLKLDEAIALLGIVQSAVVFMLREIPESWAMAEAAIAAILPNPSPLAETVQEQEQ